MKRLITFLFIVTLSIAANANPAHDRLINMSNPDRNVFLTKFLKASGENCASVTRNFYQGADKQGNAFWNAACRSGKSYVIMIYNNSTGSSKIMECDMLRKMGAVPCFKKF